MQWKYAADLSNHPECPPTTVRPHVGDAFRFVHSDLADERNFLPAAKLNPRRKLRPHEQCFGFSLSLYVTRDTAVKRFTYLHSLHENFPKTAGDSLATCTLCETDGRACNFNLNGHFEFFESDTSDLRPMFSLVEKIIP